MNCKDLIKSFTKEDYLTNRVNLHIHTTYSDGRGDFNSLVCQAKEKGFRYIAISDHNTVEGFIKNKVPDYKDFDDLVKFAKQQNKKITFGDIKSEEFRARLLLACLENDINIKELPDLSSMKNIEAETRQRLMKQKVKLLRKVAKDKSYNSLGAEAKVKKQKAEEARQTIRNGRQNGQADAEKYAVARRLIQQRQQEFRG